MLKVPPDAAPSAYELEALQLINAWRTSEPTWFQKALAVVNRPLEAGGELVMKIPGLGDALTAAASGSLNFANDIAQWSVRPEAILSVFAEPTLSRPEDIRRLDLQRVDSAIGFLNLKYKTFVGAEGGAAGASTTLQPHIAIAVIPADAAILLTSAQRMIGEYATYCSFDVNLQQERLFALHVLALATSPTDASRQVALVHLTRIMMDLARRRTWAQLEEHAFVALVRKLAAMLSIRVTQGKLAQIVPGVAIVVGAGFNLYFIDKVAEVAFFLYRERFLVAKYGPGVIPPGGAATDGETSPHDHLAGYDIPVVPGGS